MTLSRFRFNQWLVCGLVLAGLVLLGLSPAALAGHGEKRAMKKGILLVSFGTSIPEAQAVYDHIDTLAKARFKGVEVRWAFTAKMIRHKLAKQGQITMSPEMALARMAEDGFTHVAVQSLHVIPGQEYHQLYETAKRFEGMPKGLIKVLVGYPLLAGTEDVFRTAEALLSTAPADRQKDEALVFMGHGTHHPGNIYYPAMNYVIQHMDKNVMVGTVEGYPDLDDVKNFLAGRGLKKVWLLPFMSVAGDHAANDMAGDEDDSWKSILAKAGYDCRPVLVGIAAHDKVVDIWLDHLDRVLGHFKE